MTDKAADVVRPIEYRDILARDDLMAVRAMQSGGLLRSRENEQGKETSGSQSVSQRSEINQCEREREREKQIIESKRAKKRDLIAVLAVGLLAGGIRFEGAGRQLPAACLAAEALRVPVLAERLQLNYKPTPVDKAITTRAVQTQNSRLCIVPVDRPGWSCGSARR